MVGGDGEDDSEVWIQELIDYNRQAILFMHVNASLCSHHGYMSQETKNIQYCLISMLLLYSFIIHHRTPVLSINIDVTALAGSLHCSLCGTSPRQDHPTIPHIPSSSVGHLRMISYTSIKMFDIYIYMIYLL